jgi:cysteine desulfurase/selenocysteine lyase
MYENNFSEPQPGAESKRAGLNRSDFPILQTTVNGKPLVYFDNAATSQKPVQVLEAIQHYYTALNSNIHRGAHYLANAATEAYENSRTYIAECLGAKAAEIQFVRGTTEAVNLLAYSWAMNELKPGDEIVISGMEHHANIVPWQMACIKTGAVLKVIPVNESGELDMDAAEKIIGPACKLLALVYVSNALGTINPVTELISLAKKQGALVFLDGAQAVPHLKINLSELGCDFFAFSGHKVYGPTGIGVLWGKAALLNQMPPFMGGGEMIKEVSFERSTYNEVPYRFEAGTPHIEGGIVLGTAMKYLYENVGIDTAAAAENALLQYATEALLEIPGIELLGRAKHKTGVISFNASAIHPYDLGVLLDRQGIAVRTGHHCCQPLMKRFGLEGTCRASFSFYNSFEEVDLFIAALHRSLKMLS